MNISFVLAVYNKLNLTKECYKHLRNVYPQEHLIISSGGSTDGTKEWLESLNDDNLTYFHDDERLSFSETYNAGISLVDTDKLVLIHNDMVIGEGFLEALERLITEDTLLSYTTIEPPIFKGHKRPGKVILDLGLRFDDFNQSFFDEYVKTNNKNDILNDGAVFFMSGYKKMFDDIGGFDGFSFFPCFCEDDDFLIRAKLKGYKLKTCDSAITYHFVSQTSRFSDEMKDKRNEIELNSNRNFIRKWGIMSSTFNELNYQLTDGFNYVKTTLGITLDDINLLPILEPFFDEINFKGDFSSYITEEQKNTNYDLTKKFTPSGDVTATIRATKPLSEVDIMNIMKIRVTIAPPIDDGDYEVGNLIITIKKGV
jgi:GT2 family glycosyltransferase